MKIERFGLNRFSFFHRFVINQYQSASSVIKNKIKK